MSDLVLVKGDRSKLLWANQSFLDYYGMSNEALQDLVDAPHSDPDDTLQYVKDDHSVFTSGKTLDVPSEPITDAEGKRAFFHTVKTALKDEEGKVIQTVRVSHRIKDEGVQERAEATREAEKDNLRELRALVNHIPQAVAMFDVKHRFICNSPNWETLLGVQGEALLGTFYDSVLEERLPLVEVLDEAMGASRRTDREGVEFRA